MNSAFSVLRNPSLLQGDEEILSFQSFIVLIFYMSIYRPMGIDFCVRYKEGQNFFLVWISSIIYEKTPFIYCS